MGSRFASLAIVLLLLLIVVPAEPVEDKQVLLDFIGNIPHRPLNWNSSTSACTTCFGVTCDPEESRIIAVHLPSVSLNGRIPSNTISRLSALQTLSLHSNGLSSPFPPDFFNLTSIDDLHNKTGEIQVWDTREPTSEDAARSEILMESSESPTTAIDPETARHLMGTEWPG